MPTDLETPGTLFETNAKDITMETTVQGQPAQPAGIPGFDLNALRLPQNFGDSLGVKKMITRVPVQKPSKTTFFRSRQGEAWRLSVMILELKDDGEIYLVAPKVWDAVPELLRPAVLHTAIDRRGNVFLIPVPMPGEDGRRNSWHQSMADIVDMAQLQWMRAVANKGVGGYDVFVAEGKLAEPEWPAMTLQELITVAFRDRFIETPDHPTIRQLLGVS